MTERLPSLRNIEAFVCVSEVLNLRVASERLNVTVSAISHRIQGLEAELGVRLFERGAQGLTLTSEGRAYRLRILPGLQALREATRWARPSKQSRILRVAAPSIFYDQMLLPRLQEFLADWPDVRVELLTLGRKRAAGTDVLIAPLTSKSARDGAVKLFDLHLSPVCSPEFAAQHTISSPEDLIGLPLLDAAHGGGAWGNWFAAAGIPGDPPAATIQVDNQLLITACAEQGLGVALGARHMIRSLIDSGALVRPLDIECNLPPTIGITVANEEKVTRAFAEWLFEVLGE